MESLIAHDIVSVPRSEDVVLLENVTFRDMFFSEPVFKSLTANGFHKPSPIQYKAIPLARCGFDLIVQSKSGTGKTLVFVTTALESVDPAIRSVQTIVLTPTREIALQVTEVFRTVGSLVKDFEVECFIGGVSLAKDIAAVQKCQVAVGAPGRICQLIELGHLKTDAVRLFVLDEADQLMAKSFQKEINFIYWSLSEFKQMLALSATYPDELLQFLGNYMRSGKLVTPETDPVPVLKGLKQFVSLTRDHADALARLTDKENRLVSLLSSVKFNQCLIFSNYKSRAESTCNMLKCRGWSCEWISGNQAQEHRTRALNLLRQGLCRILVSTDLTARGVDSKGINLVINMDTPHDPRVYLHRMGRAGRYGSQGVVITILSRGQDLYNFRQMLGLIDKDLTVRIVPTGGDYDLWSDELTDFEEVSAIEPTSQSIEKYKSQFASTDSKSSTDSTKEKTNKKFKIIKDENSEENKKVHTPDFNDKHFPPMPVKKNILNDYFLDEPSPCEFILFSSLKDSLDHYQGNNLSTAPPVNRPCGTEAAVHSEKNNSLANSIKKSSAEDLSEVLQNKQDKDVSSPKIRNKINQVLQKENVVPNILPKKVNKGDNSLVTKKINFKEQLLVQNLETKLKTSHTKSKNIINNVSQPVRRFSYSDIAKGKRVECKPLDLKPEQITNLKKSPLKLFPSESVSNHIEGISISDKAIDGFSKRMYSAVLKDSKVKIDLGSRKNSLENPLKLDCSIIGSAKFEKNTSSDNSSVQSKNVDSIQDKATSGPNESIVKKQSDEYLQVLKDTSRNGQGNQVDQNLSNQQSGKMLGFNTQFSCASDSMGQTNAPLQKSTNERFISQAQLNQNETQIVQNVDYLKVTNSNSQDCIPRVEIFNSSFNDIPAISSPKTDLNSSNNFKPFSSINNCFYEKQISADLSRISLDRGRTKVTFDQSSTSDSSDTEGEYVISGSFSNNSSFARFQQNQFKRNAKPLGFDSWFRMYFQQAALIHNYVRYSKEFQNNQRSFT